MELNRLDDVIAVITALPTCTLELNRFDDVNPVMVAFPTYAFELNIFPMYAFEQKTLDRFSPVNVAKDPTVLDERRYLYDAFDPIIFETDAKEEITTFEVNALFNIVLDDTVMF